MKSLLKTSLLLSAISLSSMAAAIELTVTVDNIKTSEGILVLRVYSADSQWLSTDEAGPTKTEIISLKDLKGTQITKTFDLPQGIYAVTALQDLNGNKILDKDWVGRPQEPIGSTGNNEAKGPPEFKATSFELTAASEQLIHLVHY